MKSATRGSHRRDRQKGGKPERGAAAPARRFERTTVKLAVAAFSLVLALLAAEAAVRVAGAGPQYWAPARDMVRAREGTDRLPFAFVPHAIFRTVYPSDPRGYFGPGHTMDHQFNSAGWRDVEHPLDKPAGTWRVLGLGDSYLFGQGVRFDDIAFTRLGALLQRAAPPGVAVEAINTGVPGFNTEVERGLLEARGLAYRPDLVVVHFVLNDIERSLSRPGPKVEFFREYTEVYNRPDWLSSYSQLWGAARQRWQRRVAGSRYLQESLRSYLDDPEKFDAMWSALEGIRRLCGQQGARLLVVVYPFFVDLDGDYPFQPIHERMTERCRQAGIAVLDLYPAFRSYHGPELWVHPIDQHPNEKAHAIAAEAMATYLQQHRQDLGVFRIKE